MIPLYVVFSALTMMLPLYGLAQNTIAMAAASITSIAIAARWLDNRPFSDFGLRRPKGWIRELSEGIALGLTAITAIWFALWLSGNLRIDGFAWTKHAFSTWFLHFLGYFLLMAIVGFYEEFWTRGYQTKVLSEGLHSRFLSAKAAVFTAILATSAFFGLLHAGNPNASWVSAANITLAGIMLALPYVLTGRLWVSAGLHFSWNFTQGPLFGFPVSGIHFRTSIIESAVTGPEWLTGGAFGPEAGLSGTIAIILLCAVIWFRYRNTLGNEAENQFVAPPESSSQDIKTEDFVSY